MAGGYAWLSHGEKAISPEQRYRLVKVDRGDVTQLASANGSLSPLTATSVGSQVSGIVSKLYVDFNSSVKKGQPLLELDTSQYRAQADATQAALSGAQVARNLAQSSYQRNKDLHQQGFISKQALEASEQQWASAEAQHKVAAANYRRDALSLSNAVIRAPMDGVVISRTVDVGQTVVASFQAAELFKIANDLRQMRISTTFSEADIGQIKQDREATFTVDTYPRRVFKGKVSQIRLQPTTFNGVVTYNVVVDVPNEDRTLLPGMTAYVKIVTQRNDASIRVPNAALRFTPESSTSSPQDSAGNEEPTGVVWVVGLDGEPSAVHVVTGANDGKFTAITKVLQGSLDVGKEVITEDRQPPVKKTPGLSFQVR